MQDSQIINEGLALMGLGMGFVFVFLTVLVITTTLMSRVVSRYFPEPVTAPPSATSGRAGAQPDDDVMAAISMAVHRHRQRRRR